MGIAGEGAAMEAHFDRLRVEARREDRAKALDDLGRQFDVVHAAGGGVTEVGMGARLGQYRVDSRSWFTWRISPQPTKVCKQL